MNKNINRNTKIERYLISLKNKFSFLKRHSRIAYFIFGVKMQHRLALSCHEQHLYGSKFNFVS